MARELGTHDLASRTRWTAPLEHRRFAEPYDNLFLQALELVPYQEELGRFWPLGGPHWDALAIVGENSQREGVLLVEGKSYPNEVYGPGCQATSESSTQRIGASLDLTRAWLGASGDSDWTGRMYQFANRLAHLYFLRELLSVAAWLVNLCFIEDCTTTPTTEFEWRAALPSFKKEMGFPGGSIPWVVDVLLPARSRDELVRNPGS